MGSSVRARLSLGLVTRLFTASGGRPDERRPATDESEPWFDPVSTYSEFLARLDLAAAVGATQVEVTQAGQPSGAEFLVSSEDARKALLGELESRGLSISALNCSGMALHPVTGPAHQELIRKTIVLAGQLGVKTIVTMSGVGGDGNDATTINWVFYPWPADSVALSERHWGEAVEFWTEISAFGLEHGVERIAMELHPMHLVYNVPTLLRLRDAVGPTVGANVDPSHLFWQQMDPVAVVRALGEAVQHVQMKDTETVPEELAIAGVLDGRPFSAPESRAWRYRTIGRGHDSVFWREFLESLDAVGFDGGLSIENEDPFVSYEDGVKEAAAFISPLIP